MRYSAQIDSFVRDRLPVPEQMPELRFNLPELSYPPRINAAARLLDRWVLEGFGARRCVLSPDTEWSYAQLLERANQIARVLRDDLGVVAGNRVLLRAPNMPMLAACWFAVLKVGAVAVTTMPMYRAGELRAVIEKARISVALCDARLRDELAIAAQGSDLRALHFGSGERELETRMAGKSTTFRNVDTAAEDIALIGFTSGTTGSPKATVHTHRDVMAICDGYGTLVLRPREDDLFAGSPPLAFTYGLGGLLLFALRAGAATLLLEDAAPDALLPAIERYRVTTLFSAPIAYRSMTPAIARYDLSSLRTCVSAGESISKAVWEAWYAATGLRIMDGIGSTEMLHIFVGSPADEVRPGATGRAVPGYLAEIHDDLGAPLPVGDVGRLAVKGPTGCTYLDDDRQTEYVRDGWNYPGDAYRMDEDGYLWYVARTDDMIVSAGYNISGPEVEQALLAHEWVEACAVVGKPDPQHGTNVVKAFVVPRAGFPAGDDGARLLVEFCKAQIAPYKAPREIEFVAELPRTESGKLQRYKLRG